MKLSGRVIFITGGGRAIGRRIARRAAQEGADVAVIGPDQAELEATAEEIRELGRRSFAAVADVACERDVTTAVARIRESLGRIHVLVNNAGIIGPTKPLPEIDRSEWDAVLAVNLTGAFLCAKAVAPHMMEQRSGKIINLSSIAGKQAYPLRMPYAVSKWGLIGLTLTLAKELGPHNIQVNAVCPGPVEGERMRTIIANRAAELGRSAEEVERTYLSATVLGRMVREEDVASLVVFLASAEADNITGQAIDVAAGYGL
jgi:NAD(P)-dependent dehydrogenase (short-subunit alcohol dehydrogenase family)